MNNKLNILTISTFIIMIFVFFIIYLAILPLSKKEVTINTQPTGIHYKVAGVEGNTPAKIKLKAGKYQIELSGKGYKNLNESFSIRPFEKKVSISYKLKEDSPIGSNLSSSAAANNYGAGPSPNTQAEKEKAEEIKKKYPFYYKLPAKSPSFFINRPTTNDNFFIYVPKESPDEGKKAVAVWFAENGIADLSHLRIVWLYGTIK